jgi:hypothetical protein
VHRGHAFADVTLPCPLPQRLPVLGSASDQRGAGETRAARPTGKGSGTNWGPADVARARGVGRDSGY